MKNIQLSLFKGYSDTNPENINLQEVVNLIQSDQLVRDRTEKHRYYLSLNNQHAAGREKSSCPCFAVAVQFEGGKQQNNISGWTTLGIVDIDDIDPDKLPEAIERIHADPHTVISYVTMSARGIRIIFVIDGLTDDTRKNMKLYQQAFEQGNQYYADLLDCKCDLKCKNVTRLSGLAHDPDVFFNPDARAFHVTPPSKRTPSAGKGTENRRLKKTVTAATEVLETEGLAYEAHHHNEYIMRMGYLLNAYGLPLKEAVQWATEKFSDYDGNVESIINSCYQKTDEHATRPLSEKSTDSQPSSERYAGVAEIEEYLATQAIFRHNVITGEYEISFGAASGDTQERKYAAVTDRDVNSLWSRINKDIKTTRLNDIYNIIHSEYVPQYNPFQEFLSKLKPWDGVTDYIGELAATVHVKSNQAQFTECFRKWFVSIVPSVLDEQVVNHEILVLIGPQGSFKTTWLTRLLPPSLQKYFYTKVNSGHLSKDDQFTLAEFMLVCMEEIDEMRPSILNQLKAMITLKTINERAAYGHNKEHRTHIASFCATGNNIHFLNDPSGTRRWLPFEIEKIDSPYHNPINYEGVYSQALALWKSDFRYWFDQEEIDILCEHNKEFEIPNLEKELILTHFRRPMPGEQGIFVTTAYILSHISGAIKQPLSPTKIGILMKQLGFEPIRYGGQRGYRVIEHNTDEIYRNRCAAARYSMDSSDTPEEKQP